MDKETLKVVLELISDSFHKNIAIANSGASLMESTKALGASEAMFELDEKITKLKREEGDKEWEELIALLKEEEK